MVRFDPPPAALTVVVDDTLFHRYGFKTHGVFWQHDGSANGRDGIGRSNCFVVVGVVVTVPFVARAICLPVLFRLHIPKPGASKPDAARAMIGLLARAFPRTTSPCHGRCRLPGTRMAHLAQQHHLHHPTGRQRPTAEAHRQAWASGMKKPETGNLRPLAATASWRTVSVTRYGKTATVT